MPPMRILQTAHGHRENEDQFGLEQKTNGFGTRVCDTDCYGIVHAWAERAEW